MCSNIFTRLKSQTGESQMGIIVMALGIGSLIAIVTTLQSCIYETKEARAGRGPVQYSTDVGEMPVERGYQGYEVTF